jgi:transketolase
VYLYDNNHISIEGNTSLAFDREDVGKRFEAYGWHVQYVDDANNVQSLKAALQRGREEKTQPSLIIVRSHIGYGSPNKVDKASAHGSPLGEDEVKQVKQNLGFDPEQSFVVPDEVLNNYRNCGKKGAELENKWNQLFEKYAAAYPELAKEYKDLISGKLPEGWDKNLPTFKPDEKIATRKASGKMLNAIADKLPWLIGGSADLAPSTDTLLEKYDSFSGNNHSGRNFHFGVREHAMGAVLNGIALTKGFIPYGATFLIFSDYMKPPVRLSAIMEIKPIFIYTHDSIGLGEDGTTHQPVEQLLSLRAIPNMTVIRPADANETVQAWRVALQHEGGPVALVLTRQNIPVIDQDKYAKATNLEKGAYILSDAQDPSLLLIATGSEVQLALKAQELLKVENIAARVISMPSWELFNKQDQSYKDAVLPPALRKRVAIEAATPLGWQQYVTEEGAVIGVEKFGTSAPAEDVFKAYGFTAENIVAEAKKLLK